MTISNTTLGLAGSNPRSLSSETIDACAKASTEADVSSLWGKIKDWFLGTHKEDAKRAIFRLANAKTTHAQFEAFLELTRYIEPAHRDALSWCITDTEIPAFKVADRLFHSKLDWAAQTPKVPSLGAKDIGHLLLSLRYNDLPVVGLFREIGASHIFDMKSGPDADRKIDLDADRMLTAQRWYLSNAPSLLNALQIIGMHGNDAECAFACELRNQVETMLCEGGVDDDSAAVAGRNAENMMCLVTDMFDDRGHFNASKVSVGLPL